jgi:cellulose synthase/poly-beta-1,6-N-acetylglucosamine synthase-like glycosyltransferase
MVMFGLLVGMALMQAIFALAFVRLFYRPPPQRVDDADLPKASILLSLRGADPHLANGLRRLMDQDYPDYELRIVVDGESDPAWQVVKEAVADTGFQNVHVSPLRERQATCSLKCSALVQLAKELEDSTEVVVMADADLVSHDDWMRELISPLTEPGVGATFGNRWFWPRDAWWGSLVRYLWNVAAVVPMWVFSIPWGGTFAMRWQTLRDTGLVEKWSKAMVEDAPIRSELEKQGLRLRFVPQLMMVNREDCDLPFSLDFIKRQLTWTKTYHPRWAPVVIHAFSTAFVMFAGILLVPIAWTAGDLQATIWAASGLVIYMACMIELLGLLERGVRHVIRRRDEKLHHFSFVARLKMLVAIPLTQAIHLIAVLLAMFRRRVAWRGVTYHVRGPWDVEMVGYRPFDQSAEAPDSNKSL